jgi:hypothetical protein
MEGVLEGSAGSRMRSWLLKVKRGLNEEEDAEDFDDEKINLAYAE